MPFHETGSLRYYTFQSFEDEGIKHGIFTRQGGVSPQPWDSLNLGGLVGDDLTNVTANRERIFDALGRPRESVYDVWQVHGNDVVCTDAPRPFTREHLKADAILTDKPSVTLLMRFADCVPIALYDPHHKVVGLVHSGWPGTVKRAAAAAVEAMKSYYDSDPVELLAGVGPSIGVDHYPVGENVIEAVQTTFGDDASALLQVNGDAIHFDLWTANQLVLEQAGVRRIEIAAICTACHTQDWYSHRAENGKTGRFGMVINL